MPDEVLTSDDESRPVVGFFGKLPATGDFVWRVADVEHRDFQLGGDFFQIGQDFLFAPQVQRRQRFVHQQELRRGEQRAANAHPLALAAR